MKVLLTLLVLIVTSWAFANEVKVEINPPKPVAGQVYQAFFRIFTEFEGDPVINFSAFKTEVVGKANQGVTTRTIYNNGKLTTSRETTIVYELSSSDPGLAGLRDITITLGTSTIRHPSISYNVLKEAEELGDVFLMADVPKKSIFLGEGIVVRYYLYSRVPVNNLDIKKYPKLNGFLKRFLQEPDRSERVNVDGSVYLRTQIYAAKMFPEKVGELKIDPMYLTATVMLSRNGDPFGNMGFGREMKTKSLSSENIKVEVKPLPETGKPSNFTGLVGRHEFDLQVNQSRLIVNEPLEIKLTISGGGALENLEAPAILNNPALEEFETNGDLKIMNADMATKVFDYTFLAKAPITLPATSITLSYFDPDSMNYVPVQLPFTQLIVASGGQSAPSERKSKEDSQEQDKAPAPKVAESPKNLTSPIFDVKGILWRSWLPYLNFFLAGLAVVFAGGIVFKKVGLPDFSSNRIPANFKKGNFTLPEFMKWVNPLILQTGKSPVGLIKESDLSKDGKAYFIDLLSSVDYKDYSVEHRAFNFVYRSDYFKELDKYIRSVTNEDTSKLT